MIHAGMIHVIIVKDSIIQAQLVKNIFVLVQNIQNHLLNHHNVIITIKLIKKCPK